MGLTEVLLAEAEGHVRKYGRPLVTVSYAQSLDGCLTMRRGQPHPISGQATQIFTHSIRAAHDAILVGIGTVISDNPHLTVRLVEGGDPQPVVLDSSLRIPLDSNLLQERIQPIWVVCGSGADADKRAALEEKGVRVLELPAGGDGMLLLPALLKRLAENGVKTLMVEGGARVITSFLSERLADWVTVTIAPMYLGGMNVIDPAALNSGRPGLLPRLREWGHERVGDDLVMWGLPTWEGA